jgi:hypothetical protein
MLTLGKSKVFVNLKIMKELFGASLKELAGV